MDDTTFTIAFAKGYALGVLIKLKKELKDREGDDFTVFSLLRNYRQVYGRIKGG